VIATGKSLGSRFSYIHLSLDARSIAKESKPMTEYRRIEVSEVGDVAIVKFVDFKILDESNIQEMGQELFHLVEQDGKTKVLLNFSNVQFLSSAALGKLITLDKKVKKAGGQLKLSNILSDIYEVFAITKLNRLFDIQEDESDALASF
jgi:anti-anti-sigma factor